MKEIVKKMLFEYHSQLVRLRESMPNRKHNLLQLKDELKRLEAKREAAEEILAEIEKEEHPVGGIQ
ncbi:MAG: hypothetical protein J6W45_07880 [Bacteroidales bacterium]|nr:hypothetical protein [Bacteroidales bacterium]